jgi:hypothetical protein
MYIISQARAQTFETRLNLRVWTREGQRSPAREPPTNLPVPRPPNDSLHGPAYRSSRWCGESSLQHLPGHGILDLGAESRSAILWCPHGNRCQMSWLTPWRLDYAGHYIRATAGPTLSGDSGQKVFPSQSDSCSGRAAWGHRSSIRFAPSPRSSACTSYLSMNSQNRRTNNGLIPAPMS